MPGKRGGKVSVRAPRRDEAFHKTRPNGPCLPQVIHGHLEMISRRIDAPHHDLVLQDEPSDELCSIELKGSVSTRECP